MRPLLRGRRHDGRLALHLSVIDLLSLGGYCAQGSTLSRLSPFSSALLQCRHIRRLSHSISTASHEKAERLPLARESRHCDRHHHEWQANDISLHSCPRHSFAMPQPRRRPEMSLPKGKKQKTTTKSDSIIDRLRSIYKTQWENDKNRATNKALSTSLLSLTSLSHPSGAPQSSEHVCWWSHRLSYNRRFAFHLTGEARRVRNSDTNVEM